MLEVLDTLGAGERSNERANASIQSVDGSLRGLAQECFQRMEDQLDWIEIRTIRRQVAAALRRRPRLPPVHQQLV